ncbi:hypothetical protein [Pseudonocardia sediminis]|uniref:hypothetical protein n=1 Tax=Pseudonocardia sediminis TaxID=1397368 RepID=UPI00102989F3|nr:hypothetical protein [Pseudonocardia sediminis]
MATAEAVAETARAFYALLATLSRRGEQEARKVWRELDPADLRGSWDRIGASDRLMAGVGTLQLAAIDQAGEYVDRVLRAQGVDPSPLGDLLPDALTGIASDGRDLDDLMYAPIFATLADIARGKPADEAIASGEESLATIVNTQISDTGRAATDIEMAVEPQVTGYVRMLVPPSCGRCAILAGRRYRVSSGFQRHPRQPQVATASTSRPPKTRPTTSSRTRRRTSSL